MRNIIFLGAIAAMTACGYSEDKYADEAGAEVCRILVACELYDDVAACEAATEDADTTDCTFDSSAAGDCVDGLKAIEGCPDPFALPAACENVYECGADSGM
ncbi:MAG: hypothetical protein KC912_21015 [Proteobacteria bacterium]|nr:hypothetical protein [Pseudomonadota bacterium]